MNQSTITFAFDTSVPMTEVEATLHLAVMAVESLHGLDRVRMDLHVRIECGSRHFVIDTSTEVGRTLAAIFGGYVRREFGDESVGILAVVGTPTLTGSRS